MLLIGRIPIHYQAKISMHTLDISATEIIISDLDLPIGDSSIDLPTTMPNMTCNGRGFRRSVGFSNHRNEKRSKVSFT
jgi:hypothetical protein